MIIAILKRSVITALIMAAVVAAGLTTKTESAVAGVKYLNLGLSAKLIGGGYRHYYFGGHPYGGIREYNRKGCWAEYRWSRSDLKNLKHLYCE